MTIDKIKEVLADHLDMDTAGITNETTFDDLGIDSLETVEIMMELEDEFGIEIPDEAIEEIKTVGDLVSYIENNR